MAKLRMESHADRSFTPFNRALPALLAILFIQVQAVSAQYVPEPTSGTALSAPTTGPALSAPTTASPEKETVAEVRVEGNKSVPIEKITPFIRTRAGRPFDDDIVQEDVRRLDRSKMFIDVKTYFQRTPAGRIVIYKVLERPILVDVKFGGNKQVSKKKLQKESGLKAGDPLDTFAVEEARRKLEEYYRKNGYDKAHITLLEGDKPQDRNAIFLINEGVKQKVQLVSFVGNTIASDARLRTQIETGAPWVYLFQGELDRKKVDEDVEKLTAYYRGLGFFRARIGPDIHEFNVNEDYDPALLASRAFREIDQFETVQWMVVKFIIDEGPRYKIGNVSVSGNSKYTSEELLAELKLKNGEYFNQANMTADMAALRDKYGGVGYVFADIKADPRFLEEPGTLDLVYNIKEGDRYRVGRMDVAIKGEYPHTKITTILNRLSLKPGDIVDIREIRNSERRLKASQLFEMNPATGNPPKIVYSPPDKEKSDEENPTQLARKPKSPPKVRGQSPDPNRGTWNAPQRNVTSPERDREIDLVFQGTATNPEKWAQEPDQPSEMIVRGQYTPDAGRSTPSVFQRPMWGGTRPVATTTTSAASTTDANSSSASEPYSSYPSTQSAQANAYQAGTGYAQQGYPQQGAYPTTGQSYASQPQNVQQNVQPDPYQYPTTQTQPAPVQPAPVQAAPVYGYVRQPAGEFPYQAASAMPPPERPVQAIIPSDSPFSALPPDTGDPTRPLDFNVMTEETTTGRFMFGVGVNSDAGLFGSIVIDEQNFNLFRFPRGWDDIKNFTAWRGGGQRLRIEAVPGTQVQRYMINFMEPYLFDSRVSLGLSGFYYSRGFSEWFEERVGGRVALGYQFTPDLSGNIAYSGARVNISNIIDPSIPQLADVQGTNSRHEFQVSMAHDTRDNAFLATEGHLIQASFAEVLGTWQYPHAELNLRRHFTMHERPDGSGRHVLSLNGVAGYTGPNTPIYDNYFAGGFSTIRGFGFRGASPRVPSLVLSDGVIVGGQFEMLASAEYMFPITADDMLRGVVFCDTGTVEPTLGDWSNKYRVAPGFGLRISVPAMGPAPIAFDFAFPVSWNPGDRFEVFSFFVGFGR